MKKKICVNISVILFVVYPSVTQLFAFYIAPMFYGIYNFVACRNIKDMAKMYTLSLISQLISLFLAEVLLFFISSDYNDFIETPAILIINILITLIIDIIFILIKFFNRR